MAYIHVGKIYKSSPITIPDMMVTASQELFFRLPS